MTQTPATLRNVVKVWDKKHEHKHVKLITASITNGCLCTCISLLNYCWYQSTIGYDGGHCSHAAAVPGSRCSDQWVWLLRLPERGGGLHRGRAGPRPRLPGSAAARNNTVVACNLPSPTAGVFHRAGELSVGAQQADYFQSATGKVLTIDIFSPPFKWTVVVRVFR